MVLVIQSIVSYAFNYMVRAAACCETRVRHSITKKPPGLILIKPLPIIINKPAALLINQCLTQKLMLPDVPIYDELPDGWVDISHIVSAPTGFNWINNHKSIFNPDYRHALLRMTQKKKEPIQLTLW